MVESVETQYIPVAGGTGFTIADTSHSGAGRTLASPDVAMCAECAVEQRDPGNRRYRHAFVNCTNCGPRFTIVRGVPYDRPLTTMAAFAMCADCKQEYEDPADRRRTIVAIPKSKERAVNHGLLNRANYLRRTLDRLTPQQRDGLVTGLNTLTEELAKGHG